MHFTALFCSSQKLPACNHGCATNAHVVSETVKFKEVLKLQTGVGTTRGASRVQFLFTRLLN